MFHGVITRDLYSKIGWQRFPHVGPHFPHSKTITKMTRLQKWQWPNDGYYSKLIRFILRRNAPKLDLTKRKHSHAHINCNNLSQIRPLSTQATYYTVAHTHKTIEFQQSNSLKHDVSTMYKPKIWPKLTHYTQLVCRIHVQYNVLKTRTRGRSNKFTTPCLAATPTLGGATHHSWVDWSDRWS